MIDPLYDINTEALIGKKVIKAEKSEDGERFTFTFSDDTTHTLRVEGDCCSNSWIEDVTLPELPATIVAINDDYQMDLTDGSENAPEEGQDWPPHECLLQYQTKFITDKGDIIMEYRNSNNGYYGGYVVSES